MVAASSATACVAPTAAVIPQPTGPVNPSGPLPSQTVFPFENFGVSDTPSNFDYSFRAGLFAGDYNGLAIADGDNTAYAFWTDARNGRSSRTQAGRNPACEQSDVFIDGYSAAGKAAGQSKPQNDDSLFLVTPCPTDIIDKGN
jgi:hypothetical protein